VDEEESSMEIYSDPVRAAAAATPLARRFALLGSRIAYGSSAGASDTRASVRDESGDGVRVVGGPVQTWRGRPLVDEYVRSGADTSARDVVGTIYGPGVAYKRREDPHVGKYDEMKLPGMRDSGKTLNLTSFSNGEGPSLAEAA